MLTLFFFVFFFFLFFFFLQVFAYYEGEKSVSPADEGTILRFVERHESHVSAASSCKLPGLFPVTAAHDPHALAAYCDHWVSNVVSRTGFLDTLADTLGFSSKVDFNAGVVAAGEAQIESTVTGNTSKADVNFSSALKDQSQVRSDHKQFSFSKRNLMQPY